MSNRFFIDGPIGDTATLAGPEAHHLLHVMRAKVGEDVTLFDGGGDEFTATITATRRSEVELTVTARHAVDRETPHPIVLGVAMPKGDRQKQLVEKLTELGVARLVPLVTEWSVAAPKSSAFDKLRRTVIEASKQCGRNRLMEIAPPTPFEAFVSEVDTAGSRLIAHPGAGPLGDTRFEGPCTVAVGPEGGFSDAEAAFAVEKGWAAVSFGPRILRVETAAQAFAAILATRCG